MPCSHRGHRYGAPGAYPCPQCGYYHPPGYPLGQHPEWGGPGWSYAPPQGWTPPGPPPMPPGPRAPQGYAYVPGYGPAAVPPMNDEDIRRTADSYLISDSRIPAQVHIEVEVNEGVVTLTGSVPDKWVKRSATDVVLYLPGVVDVQNNLQVGRQRGPEAGSAPY